MASQSPTDMAINRTLRTPSPKQKRQAANSNRGVGAGVSEDLGKFFKAEGFLKMTKSKADQTKLEREIKY